MKPYRAAAEILSLKKNSRKGMQVYQFMMETTATYKLPVVLRPSHTNAKIEPIRVDLTVQT